jgi:superfamily II DNA or RNA helicase
MFTAREYQTSAILATVSALSDHSTVGVVLPTGSGKSYIESMIIDKLMPKLIFGEGIIVVSHIADVVDQLMDAFVQFSEYKNNAFRLKGNDKPRIQSKVFFTTIQTLIGDRAKEFFSTGLTKKLVKYIIIDEAQWFGCDSYYTLTNEMFPAAKVIGFSATPYRNNQFSFGQFQTVSYAIDSQSLIDLGFLCPPKLLVMDIGNQTTPERIASVVRIYLDQERSRGFVSVVYARSKMEAQELRLAFEEAKVRVEYVSGESTEKYCRELYQRARAGEVEVIVNCRKLETGIDIPNIGGVFMPWPIKSVTGYLQRIGRALRPFPGKRNANIYVFGDAPSLKDAKWARLHRDAITAKDPLDPIENLVDDLEDLESEAGAEDRIAWTKTAIDACKELIRDDLRPIALLIAEKRFPQRYNRAIKRIVTTMRKLPANDLVASDAHIEKLTTIHGFKKDDIISLSASEASSLILALDAYLYRDPFVLKRGPHAGKHIGETPPMYRRYIKDPDNKTLWLKWVRQGRPEEKRDDHSQ